MTDRLWLDPAQATDGARNLSAAGRHFRSLRDTQGGAVVEASGPRPWGSDDIGAAFEKNYRPIEQHVMQAMQQLAAYVEGLGDAAAASVQDNLAADRRGSAEVRQSYRAHQ